MTPEAPAPAFGPFSFELTDEDVRAAASRAGLRTALAGRLSSHHLAPLAGFTLFIAFAAILAFTGLISRRHGEAALLLAAMAFLAMRASAHWRLRQTQKQSLAAFTALQRGGAVGIAIDERGLVRRSGDGVARFDFVDCQDAEETGDMLYLWPKRGLPAFIPTHALAQDEASARLLAMLRDSLARARRSGAATT